MSDFVDTPSFSDDLRRYVGLVWHWAWLIILLTILAGGIAYFFSLRQTPIYQASAKALINQAPSSQSSVYAALVTSQRLADTYAEMMTTQPILDRVVENLTLNTSSPSLRGAINVDVIGETQFILVKVQHPDPVLAAQIANEVVLTFATYIQEFQTSRYADTENSLAAQLEELNQRVQTTYQSLQELGENPPPDLQFERDRLETSLIQNQQLYASLLQTYESVRLAKIESTSDVILIEPAVVPVSPISPRVMQNTMLAAVVGGMLAVGIIFLIDVLDNTIKGPDDVARHLGLPVLGMIARTNEKKEDPPITLTEPRSPVSEAYRALRTNLQFASIDNPIRSILITSVAPAEGKTTIAANLGVTIAQGGTNVILLDADLRKPKLHRKLNLPNRKGLTSLFMQPEIVLDGSVQKTAAKNLYLMASGSLPPNPSELLASERMENILERLNNHADILVVDTPPIMAVTDSMVLSTRVDGILLIIKSGETKIVAVQQAVNQLRRLGANILGVVLNEVPTRGSRYYYYSNGYYAYQTYYEESDNGQPKKSPLGRRRKVKR